MSTPSYYRGEPTWTLSNDGVGEPPTKKRRGVSEDSHVVQRRQVACHTCRLRKVKCDKQKPYCSLCKTNGSTCKYPEKTADTITLEAVTRTLLERFDRLQGDAESLKRVLYKKDADAALQLDSSGTRLEPISQAASQQMQVPYTLESSRDFLQIPPHWMSADTILEWTIFRGKYPRNALIREIFQPKEDIATGAQGDSKVAPVDEVVRFMGLDHPDDERIPQLVECFLQNVHTKNPILDVEALVKHGRRCAANGVGWDGFSCLVLLACALGSVAKPFDRSVTQQTVLPRARPSLASSVASSVQVYHKELQQAESYFALACRRLGSLKHTILGAQCHFFAGVYLMYTLRPILSWQYFFHASTLLQLHLKTTYGIGESHLKSSTVSPRSVGGRKINRLEQSLYWSCFKSECEFRVELPFPQSELSLGDYPNLFPSPPSPKPSVSSTSVRVHGSSIGNEETVVDSVLPFSASPNTAHEGHESREHTKHPYNEEESWYYYLTEIALRRIGNRIINSFFCQDRSFWLNIKPFLRIAQEFEVQVSSWSANLPPAMQNFETTSAIRAPHLNAWRGSTGNHVSRELSWAIDNRLLEMQTWLYQPFLYYLVHVGVTPLPPIPRSHPYHKQLLADGYARDGYFDILLNPYPMTPSPASDSHGPNLGAEEPSSMDNEDLILLRSMIVSGIECNLKTLEVRSIGHRHHGLWFDLRSVMCASLTLLAVVKSGNAAWIPGGAETLLGPSSAATYSGDLPMPIGGKIRKVLEQFSFWSAEAPDMLRYKTILEAVARDAKGV